MRIDQLDYELPEAAIAQQPLADRAASRLLAVHPDHLEHHLTSDLASLIPANALLVLNDTRVHKARLHAVKETGGRAEVLLLRCTKESGDTSDWEALLSANRRLLPGARLSVGAARIVVGERVDVSGVVAIRLQAPGGYAALLATQGHVPLPPYIRRPDTLEDEGRYQTVYARVAGSAAAPTAGLHLTEATLEGLRQRGVEIEFVTLHVGGGTFLPVRTEDLADHPMHEESLIVSRQLAEAVSRAKADGRPIVAVGTTVVRALESASALGESGELRLGDSATRLLIAPGYRFRVVSALLTNFHAPRSTLLALVAACVGRERWRRVYAAALDAHYRFLSYGDAMWIPAFCPAGAP